MGRQPWRLVSGAVARTHSSTVYGAEPKASAETAPAVVDSAALPRYKLPPAAAQGDGESCGVGDGEGDGVNERLRVGDAVAVIDGDDGEAEGAQSLAMTAATCACVSAYAKMRTLSRSPVKGLGKFVVPELPTVSGVAVRLTTLLLGLIPENSLTTASAPSTYTARLTPSKTYA